MSLNKTLDRLFDEVRREAKRNPAFADRLDAVLRLHESRRDVADEVTEEVSLSSVPASRKDSEVQRSPAGKAAARRAAAPLQPAMPTAVKQNPPPLNPAGLYKRAGEGALTEALAALDLAALRALIIEHNLDPSGVTEGMPHEELAAHIVAQAKRRAERDDKMFDY